MTTRMTMITIIRTTTITHMIAATIMTIRTIMTVAMIMIMTTMTMALTGRNWRARTRSSCRGTTTGGFAGPYWKRELRRESSCSS